MSEDTKKEIRGIYCELFEVPDSKEIPITDLLNTLSADKLLERFAYRKRN